MSPDDIRLEQTCSAFPEQYDAFVGDKQVGYLRLRHSYFSVEVPDCGGEIVYEVDDTNGLKGDGQFSDDEREKFMAAAKDAIVKYFSEIAG